MGDTQVVLNFSHVRVPYWTNQRQWGLQRIRKLHSEVLVPWIGEQPYIQMLSQKFFNIATCIRDVAKNTKSIFQCTVFLQSRGQGLKWWKTKGQICPLLSNKIRTLSPGFEDNYRYIEMLNLYFYNIPIYMVMLENCRNNISMFWCAPIKGTTYFWGEIQM